MCRKCFQKKLFGLLDIKKSVHQYIIWITIVTSRSCPNLTRRAQGQPRGSSSVGGCRKAVFGISLRTSQLSHEASAELEIKLMEAKRVSESSTEGFKQIVSRIRGEAFYEMAKRGRLQI